MLTQIEHGLRHTSPERQGVSSAAILRFVEALERQIHEIHSFMLVRHGCVVAEGWWSPYGRQYRHMLFSLSKSFTSTAVGLAVSEGRFSVDDTVLSFFPEETPAEVSDFLAAMRVRHLLSMSTGHADDTWLPMVGRSDGKWTQAFFEAPVRYAPGTHFLYNTGATYMLAAIVQKTTGMKLIDYLTPRLFEPLGIEKVVWEESPQGIHLGGTGLSIKTEDIARFGQLYLQKGMWQGKRILSEAWIAEATTAHISNGNDANSDWAQGYGYQFWRCRHGAYRGDGAFGQYCIVMPEQDAVLAITGGVDIMGMQPPLNLVWEMLLPAMGADALPDDAASEAMLARKLSSLHMLPVQGQAVSPSTARVSGRTYAVDANALKIETLALDFGAAGGMVRVKTAAGEERIPCGYGVWQEGQTRLFNEPWQVDPTPIITSGAWTAGDTFTTVVRLYETPFFHTLTLQFVDDELLIEARVNASFDSLKPRLMTGRAV